MSEESKIFIEEQYLKYVSENYKLPTGPVLQRVGISERKIRSNYSSLGALHEVMRENYSKELEKYIYTQASAFSDKKLKEVRKLIKKYNRFVIVCAVNGQRVNVPYYKSIKLYCKKNNAILLILPVDGLKASEELTFDPILKNEYFVWTDEHINKNLLLCSIKFSARKISDGTLTNFSRNHGSTIFGHPRQNLRYVTNSPDKEKYTRAIAGTGAITLPNYDESAYMRNAAASAAKQVHVSGAIIVEKEDDIHFHKRQIQADENGSFIDLGVQYNADGTTQKVSRITLIMGDLHVGDTDPEVMKSTEELCKELKVNDLVVHDIFNGASVNHHIIGNRTLLEKQELDSKHLVEEEIKAVCHTINWMLSICTGKVFIAKSNHDEWCNKWLDLGAYHNNAHRLNRIYGAEIYLAMSRAMEKGEAFDPLKYACLQTGIIKEPERVIWWDRETEHRIGGVLVSQHGDKGMHGSKSPTLDAIYKFYGACVVAHSHHAGIADAAWRVGTKTRLKLSYNMGSPSSWTQTDCLIYDNGQRQLINYINGKYRRKRK